MSDYPIDSRWPAAHAVFPLSKIHRLLRPLRTALVSLQHAINQSSNRHRSEQSLLKKQHRYFSEQKSQKRRAAEDVDFYPVPKRKYKPAKRLSLPTRRPTNPVSSPIFSSPLPGPLPRPTSVWSKLSKRASSSAIGLGLSHAHCQEDDPAWLDMQTKIDKLVLAYRNILDAICADDDRRPRRLSDRSNGTGSSSGPAAQVDRLTTVCARVIGRSIEMAVLEAGADEDAAEEGESESVWLATESDWKTSVMDEWYDAIPLLYRRHALAQHALSLILLSFASTAPSSVLVYHLKLFHALHLLHRTYVSRLVQPQALLLLPSLFALSPAAWFELYDDYSHKFGLSDAFVARFMIVVQGSPFEYWADWHAGLAGFVDLAIDRFGALAIEAWVAERERLVARRARWRRSAQARIAGLESSDGEGLHEDMVCDFDKRTSGTLVRWFDALVAACMPTAVGSGAARGVLNAVSRSLFDCLAGSVGECSAADNYLLSVLAITVEAHRLALFGLAMFNMGPLDRPGCTPEWASPHTPLRLQALVPERGSALGRKMLAKAAKLFFRAHRHTRLLAMLPGPGSGAPIPGLDALLRTVVEGDCALEMVAKSWVESLLLTDPASWWTRPSQVDDGSEEEDTRAWGAQDVRSWLEDWLGVLDDAERLRAVDSDCEEGEEDQDDSLTLPATVTLASATGTAEDAKPEAVCTCVSHGEEQEQQAEADDKPAVEAPVPYRPAADASNVRVVVPTRRSGRGKRSGSSSGKSKSIRLRRPTPPCTRAQLRKKAIVEREGGDCGVIEHVVGGRMSGSAVNTKTRTVVENEELEQGEEERQEHQAENDDDDDDDDFDAMDLLRRPTPSVVSGGGSRYVTPVARVGGSSGGGGGVNSGSGWGGTGGTVNGNGNGRTSGSAAAASTMTTASGSGSASASASGSGSQKNGNNSLTNHQINHLKQSCKWKSWTGKIGKRKS